MPRLPAAGRSASRPLGHLPAAAGHVTATELRLPTTAAPKPAPAATLRTLPPAPPPPPKPLPLPLKVWHAYPQYDLPDTADAESMSAANLQAVQARCQQMGYAGFSVFNGKAFMKFGGTVASKEGLKYMGPTSKAIFYLYGPSPGLRDLPDVAPLAMLAAAGTAAVDGRPGAVRSAGALYVCTSATAGAVALAALAGVGFRQRWFRWQYTPAVPAGAQWSASCGRRGFQGFQVLQQEQEALPARSA